MSRDRRTFRIRNSAYCALLIGNGAVVALVCHLLVRPMLLERAELMGTAGARLEVDYASSVVGVGLLISTAIALVSMALLRRLDPSKERDQRDDVDATTTAGSS